MSETNLLAEYRKLIEKRLSETIDRHAKIDPNVNLARMVDRQIAEELERLRKLLGKEERPEYAELWEELLRWVPRLGKELKAGRYRSG